jgi:hypothetical protein
MRASPPSCCTQALEARLQQGLAAVQHYVAGFEGVRDMVVANRSFSADAVRAAVEGGQMGLLGLRGLLVLHQQQLADVQHIPATT